MMDAHEVSFGFLAIAHSGTELISRAWRQSKEAEVNHRVEKQRRN